MYHILLLREEKEKDCRAKDYLQLSGYDVDEEWTDSEVRMEHVLQHKDLILLFCADADKYVGYCEWLRSITDLPVVVLSKSDDEWTKIKMFQAGADDYLVEPCQQAALVAQIMARINQYKRLTRVFGYIQVRGLVIEVLNRKVYLNGEEVLMTAKEFELLLYLAQHANMVVGKEELYLAIWKEELGDGFYNSVASYVRKLREKIETNPNNPQFIETIWGIGYRFVGS